MKLSHTALSGLTPNRIQVSASKSVWKHKDSDGSGVGPSYPTKSEALADTVDYAERAGWMMNKEQIIAKV